MLPPGGQQKRAAGKTALPIFFLSVLHARHGHVDHTCKIRCTANADHCQHSEHLFHGRQNLPFVVPTILRPFAKCKMYFISRIFRAEYCTICKNGCIWDHFPFCPCKTSPGKMHIILHFPHFAFRFASLYPGDVFFAEAGLQNAFSLRPTMQKQSPQSITFHGFLQICLHFL